MEVQIKKVEVEMGLEIGKIEMEVGMEIGISGNGITNRN